MCSVVISITSILLIHYVCVDTLFPLEKTIPIMFERIITHYQSLQTWIGHNATHYSILNALPLALLHALSYIVSQFTMV